VRSLRTSDGAELSYQDVGRGKPIIFVHGWAATKNFWHRQVEELSPRFRTITLDLRGHGDSEKGLDLDYSVDRLTSDLLELIELLGIENYVVVGHSLGAVIATRSANRRTGAGGLVLTGAGPRIRGGFSFFLLRILMRFRWLAERYVTPRMFAPNTRRELLDFVRAESARSSRGTLVSVMKHAVGAELLGGEIDLPVMVIAGEHDSVVSPSEQRGVAEEMKAKFVLLRGAGHNLMLEKHAEFSDIIAEFASSV